MILSFDLAGPKLAHMQPKHFGAFVQYLMGMANIYSVETFVKSPKIRVSFEILGEAQLVDQAKISQQLQAEVDALADLDPHPCPCGCGAYIAISPCFRQSGDLVEMRGKLTVEEFEMAKINKTMAIKMVRERTGFGLKDAKDLCDQSGAYPYPFRA